MGTFSRFVYDHYGNLKTPALPELEGLKGRTVALAVDCEMVGVGPGSPRDKKSTLARVSIVNEHGFCLYDSFVKPHVPVTDYRTQFSGVRKENLQCAPPFGVVVKQVADILEGRVLIGHGLENDLTALGLAKSFPIDNCRDTAIHFLPEGRHPRWHTPGLKCLVRTLLGTSIQDGEHSSITDAQAVMGIYQRFKSTWEAKMRGSADGIREVKILRQQIAAEKENFVVAP